MIHEMEEMEALIPDFFAPDVSTDETRPTVKVLTDAVTTSGKLPPVN
jgi:hypothetical protein